MYGTLASAWVSARGDATTSVADAGANTALLTGVSTPPQRMSPPFLFVFPLLIVTLQFLFTITLLPVNSFVFSDSDFLLFYLFTFLLLKE